MSIPLDLRALLKLTTGRCTCFLCCKLGISSGCLSQSQIRHTILIQTDPTLDISVESDAIRPVLHLLERDKTKLPFTKHPVFLVCNLWRVFARVAPPWRCVSGPWSHRFDSPFSLCQYSEIRPYRLEPPVLSSIAMNHPCCTASLSSSVNWQRRDDMSFKHEKIIVESWLQWLGMKC